MVSTDDLPAILTVIYYLLCETEEKLWFALGKRHQPFNWYLRNNVFSNFLVNDQQFLHGFEERGKKAPFWIIMDYFDLYVAPRSSESDPQLASMVNVAMNQSLKLRK